MSTMTMSEREWRDEQLAKAPPWTDEQRQQLAVFCAGVMRDQIRDALDEQQREAS